MPDYSVPHFEAEAIKDGKKRYIKRYDCAVIDIVPNLPTNTALWAQTTDAFFDYSLLVLQIFF